MFPNRAAKLPPGLNLDVEDYDENKDLKEFYERNLSYFFTISMKSIRYNIMMRMAVWLFKTRQFNDDWRKYAEEMGIDNDSMDEIEASAWCRNELPIYFVMKIKVRTFGCVIQALLNTERFDVLKEIESYAESLLPKQTSSSASSVIYENTAEKHSTFQDISASEQKCELNFFQQQSINGLLKKNAELSDSLKFQEENLDEMKIPIAPEEEKITALITHAESEIDIAEQVSAEFRREGIFATPLAQVNNFTQYASERVLNTVFNEVNFLVPIVSTRFLEEIYPENHDQYLESVHAQNNKYLYDLCLMEYKKNRCINFRVRPIIVPGMSRRLITEPILSYSFRLDKEIPKLIKVLKETKDLNAQQLVK